MCGKPESVGVVSRTKEEESKLGREKRQSVGENFSLFCISTLPGGSVAPSFTSQSRSSRPRKRERKEDTGEKNLLFSFPPSPDPEAFSRGGGKPLWAPPHVSCFSALSSLSPPLSLPRGKEGREVKQKEERENKVAKIPGFRACEIPACPCPQKRKRPFFAYNEA